MAKKKTNNKDHFLSRKATEKTKKQYFKMADSHVIKVRMNAAERSLLESSMRKDNWDNVSGYIKYKLFGISPERRIRELIKRKNSDELAILLRNTVLDLTDQFIYFRYRYERDMRQLYREEGVDLKKWTSSTNRWHTEVAKRTEEALNTIRAIASELGFKEYFNLPSASMNVNAENASKEDMDKLAEQMHKERIMMGRIYDE